MENPFENLDCRLERIEQYLIALNEKVNLENSDQDSVDQMLTVEEAAGLLKLSKQTLYRYVQLKVIPVHKKGKRLYFIKSELVDWVKTGRKKTMDEIIEETEDRLINTRRS